jgi:hypothetical protein
MNARSKSKKPEASAASSRAVAYYRRSAQDRQGNSIPVQRTKVLRWAEERGIEIIREFMDCGRGKGQKDSSER